MFTLCKGINLRILFLVIYSLNNETNHTRDLKDMEYQYKANICQVNDTESGKSLQSESVREGFFCHWWSAVTHWVLDTCSRRVFMSRSDSSRKLWQFRGVCFLAAVEGSNSEVDMVIHGVVADTVTIRNHGSKTHNTVCLWSDLKNKKYNHSLHEITTEDELCSVVLQPQCHFLFSILWWFTSLPAHLDLIMVNELGLLSLKEARTWGSA